MEISTESKMRITALEREVFKTGMLQQTEPPFKLPKQVIMHDVVALRPEQDNRIRKYITTT